VIIAVALVGWRGARVVIAQELVSDPAPADGDTYFTVVAESLPADVVKAPSMDATLIDLDGDDDLDVILCVEFGPNVVLLNDGIGGFAGITRAFGAYAHDTEDAAVADFNGDGAPDVVFVSEDTEANEYHVGDPTGFGFVDNSASFPVEGVSNAVEAFDADGDGDLDLAIGNDGRNALLLNDGFGVFSDVTATNLPEADDVTQDIQAGDIDGDGDIDLIVANEGRNRVLVNSGDGVFRDDSESKLQFREAPEVTRQAALIDVDDDGDLDVYFANTPWAPGADARDRLLMNNGVGVFVDETEQRLPGKVQTSLDAVAADVNGDGAVDIVSARFLPLGVTVLINMGDGRFVDETTLYVPAGLPGLATDVEVADIDGLGAMDVYVASWSDVGDRLLLGDD
jgi:hypothetical protein